MAHITGSPHGSVFSSSIYFALCTHRVVSSYQNVFPTILWHNLRHHQPSLIHRGEPDRVVQEWSAQSYWAMNICTSYLWMISIEWFTTIFKQIFFSWFITFLCLWKELLLGTSLTVSWQALLGAHTVTAQVKRRRKNDHWIRKTSIIAILYDHNWISRMITFCWSSFFSDHQLIYFLLLTGRKNTVTVQVKSNPPNPDKNIADKILALLYLTLSHSSPVKWSSCYSCLNSLSPFSGFEQNCVPGRFVTIWLLIPVYQNCFWYQCT